MMKRAALLAACAAITAGMAATGYAYSTYAKWSSVPVSFFINPNNNDVSASAAISAFQTALNVWSTQSGSSFRFQYAGTSNNTSTGYDNQNVLIFRNSGGTGAVASTYSWWDSGGRLLDSDIIVWDGSYTFFTGTSGCSGGLYIEDIATHELGHSLGLDHSGVADATMYPSVSWCSQDLRTLASDDISGVRSLYGGSAPSNTPPTVVITSPANGATYPLGSTISLSGSAYDSQDGDLTSQIQWSTNGLSGLLPLGVGSLLTHTLDALGTQTFVANITDSGNLTGSSQVSVTVTVLSAPLGEATQAILTATGRKVRGLQKANLAWSGLAGSSFDVYRNGTRVTTVSDKQSYTDPINLKGSGTYNYLVCEAGTQTCTNTATVTF